MSAAAEAFIARWKPSGGAENAAAKSFIDELCALLGVPKPDPPVPEERLNVYVHEKRVDRRHRDGSTTAQWIDCYNKDHFVLEAKQGSDRAPRRAADPNQPSLLPAEATAIRGGTARRGTAAWDTAMRRAYRQAVGYVVDLPADHRPPPFVLLVDVGYVIEVYADFSGQGRNYTQFPDRRSFQIRIDDLRDAAVRERLAAIWTDPQSLDPTRRSAEVTRDIAERLARIAQSLERRGFEPKDVAEFLMRCLFTMFAEDVGLLPENGFHEMLGRYRERPDTFAPALEALWRDMDEGGFSPSLDAVVKRFNGTLFKTRKALPLEPDEIHELWVAAGRDWSDVEPAIFGTLLERALEDNERSRLGAHYTPRVYVERLVIPTIIEPLRSDWEAALALVNRYHEQGEDRRALETLQKFHRDLCTTRVLDPACGTGNFLYVAMELMKRLEAEVLDAIRSYGGRPSRYRDHVGELGRLPNREMLIAGAGDFTVEPHQFFGLEINPRAAAIADLVLWIGFLKWQLKTRGMSAVSEPVLKAYGTIRQQDAILAWDGEPELVRDEAGRPVTVWDGRTMKTDPVTGGEVPDETARIEVYRYRNPRRADWPEADFIVGNPPFIGGGQMRAELGDGYAEAVWHVRPDIPPKSDFVMHFWDEAARHLVDKNADNARIPLRRFGFITTNSISQTFSRRVVERWRAGNPPLSLVFAIPDHPWLKGADRAAVRISMTVAERGENEGTLGVVYSEDELDTDTPRVLFEKEDGVITPRLRIGADISSSLQLLSNESLSSNGPMLGGSGFIISPERALIHKRHIGQRAGLVIKPYIDGRDLTARTRGRFVIDLFGMSDGQVSLEFPELYQHVIENVKPMREQNRRDSYRLNWWIFSEPRRQYRDMIRDIDRYIVTTETSRHRFFRFVDGGSSINHMVIAIGSDLASHLSVLSSRIHVIWALAAGGWLGVGNDPRYSKTRTFDPFPFPDAGADSAAAARTLSVLGERLDAFRKDRLAALADLTMTKLYNALERYREARSGGEPFSEEEREVHTRAQVAILAEIHDEIDRAVLAAYGWDDLAPALVGRPGGTIPSDVKAEDQLTAEEDLLARLVALNQARAAEEKRGHVRWLRPDYQIPRLGHRVSTAGEQAEADVDVVPVAAKPPWPSSSLPEQIVLVRDLLKKADAPVPATAIAAAFDGRNTRQRKDRIAELLDSLVATGAARSGETPDGERRYFAV